MKFAGRFVVYAVLVFLMAPSLAGQKVFPLDHPLAEQTGLVAPGPSQAGLPAPQGFDQYITGGKLHLSLEDAIRLALANNTDIQIDRSSIRTSQDAVERAKGRFDPSADSSFTATRSTSPTYGQLQGATTLSTLSQNAAVGYAQTFETGTSVQANVSASKNSSNSSFNYINPYISGSVNLSFTQPLLRGGGLFVNREPIVIAQRNLSQTRDNFEAQVNAIIQNVVIRYWGVVGARENLAVQQKSLAEAQQSYDRDKRSLQLGALSPLDIYSSQSQVASVQLGVIQAQYALTQAEDAFRNVIGADIEPRLRALGLELTEKPEPTGALMTVDISTALEKALNNRPEIEAVRESLLNDRASIRLAHNGLLPNLSLSGNLSSNGLSGNQYNLAAMPPALVSAGGFGDALDQAFGFGFPVYEMGFQLSLPIRNRSANADMADALVSQRRDLYSERQLRQTITLDIATAVENLEESKQAMAAAKNAYDLAEKNLEAQQRKYELGGGQIEFVLQAQTSVAAAQESAVNAEIGYQNAVTSVEYQTGALLSRYRVQIGGLAQ